MPKYKVVFISGTDSVTQLGPEIEIDAEDYQLEGEGATEVYRFFKGKVGSPERRFFKQINAVDVLTVEVVYSN